VIAMRRSEICIAALAALIAGTTAASAQQGLPKPCAALRQVCMQAGFVPQGARTGDGLMVDCIRPIMMGDPQPQRATKPLPAVDPQLVAACRAQKPDFGMVNAARQQQRMQRQGPAMQGPPPPMGPPPEATPDEPPQAPPGPPAPR
jgi:hypothetical protein